MRPISKRWPGKYAIQGTIYTPKGKSLDLETDLPPKLAEKFVEDVVRHICATMDKARDGHSSERYVSTREIDCMGCRKPGRCDVAFEYTESGKVNAAYVVKIEKDWEYRPYGDVGGDAPYCPDCLKEKKL